MELIEGVDEFLLCGFLTYNKLDIIDQKNVYGSVLMPQTGHGRGIAASDGLDHFICELFGCDI